MALWLGALVGWVPAVLAAGDGVATDGARDGLAVGDDVAVGWTRGPVGVGDGVFAPGAPVRLGTGVGCARRGDGRGAAWLGCGADAGRVEPAGWPWLGAIACPAR